MKYREVVIIISIIFLIFSLIFLSKEEIIDVNDINQDKIENFDIILSKGQSLQSKILRYFNISVEDFSHIGIIVLENNELFVLHSTPDGTKNNSIRFDDFQTFIKLSNVSDIIILRNKQLTRKDRLNLHTVIKRYRNIEKPFDYDFDNFNSDNLYCSELIYYISKEVNLLYSDTFNLEKPIYPILFKKLEDFEIISL